MEIIDKIMLFWGARIDGISVLSFRISLIWAVSSILKPNFAFF